MKGEGGRKGKDGPSEWQEFVGWDVRSDGAKRKGRFRRGGEGWRSWSGIGTIWEGKSWM